MKYQGFGTESDFEPCSNQEVLKNKLGITTQLEINQAENTLLLRLYESVFEPSFTLTRLKTQTLCDWHRIWLSPLYEWAGHWRTVNMSKDGFLFAAAHLLPQLLLDFEQKYLCVFSDLHNYTEDELISFLAQSHVELILIHPFREGNGRLSRLLLDVMSTQAGFTPLDYSTWSNDKSTYIKAIHQGMTLNYSLMEQLVRQAIELQLTTDF